MPDFPALAASSKQFRQGFEVARLFRDPQFRKALRRAGFVSGMTIRGDDVLDAIRSDGRGGWTVLRKIKPVEDTHPGTHQPPAPRTGTDG